MELEKMTGQNEASDHQSLRIMQMGSTAYRGGVRTAIMTLCSALHQKGHEVMLVSDGGDLDALREKGIECIVTDFSQKPASVLRGSQAVGQAIRQFSPDVVHVHGRAPALRSYLSGRVPDWFTLHNAQFTDRVSLLDTGMLRRFLSPMGRRFFVFDEKARMYLCRSMGISPSKVEVIINGVDCDRYREPTAEERQRARAQFGVADGQTLILFVGRLHFSKQPMAITAAAKVARDAGRTDLRFALVGQGDLEEQVRCDIEDNHLQDICKLYGWMDPLQAYFAADLLVMPSLYEGFAMVPIEALATGLPVLRSRTGGAEQTIIEGKTGFCCGTDVPGFIDRLMSVLEQPEQLFPMRSHARELVQTQLSSQIQADMLVRHYRAHLSPLRERQATPV